MTSPEASSLPEWFASRIETFLKSFESFAHVTKPYLSLVALHTEEGSIVLAARILFASPTVSVNERVFTSASLTALTKRLSSVEEATQCLYDFAFGKIELDSQVFVFPPQFGSGLRLEVEKLHPDASTNQMRAAVLTFRGREVGGLYNSIELDWELRASDPPYAGLSELMLDFGLGLPQGYIAVEAFHATPL